MEWMLDKRLPICPQIEEQICAWIVSGRIEKSGKLMSVREIATEAEVNPNTVQKALEGLEAEGLIYSVRGSGWYVSEQTDKAEEKFERLLKRKTESYINEMRMLGLTPEQIKEYIKEWNI